MVENAGNYSRHMHLPTFVFTNFFSRESKSLIFPYCVVIRIHYFRYKHHSTDVLTISELNYHVKNFCEIDWNDKQIVINANSFHEIFFKWEYFPHCSS